MKTTKETAQALMRDYDAPTGKGWKTPAAPRYTREQARQMERDTTFEARTYYSDFAYAEERDFAVVAEPTVGESDPRFYIDTEWQAWMGDAHPEWSVEDMTDSTKPGESWVVWVIRRVES